LRPDLNSLSARILDRLGITTVRVPALRCCGALSHHLSAVEEARRLMRDNIDAWWPLIEEGAEAIVSNTSACSLMLKDYGQLLRDDPDYGPKAARISVLSRDITEILAAEDLTPLAPASSARQAIAFHAPCTLQHGLQLAERTTAILEDCGYRLLPVRDAHLCCGAAGAYNILQPVLSRQLQKNKLAALEQGGPRRIATANIGCLLHLQQGTKTPVVHWLELLAAE
ncbi:MAG: heterodisulfide reductase-related iron-sulfur binding cluster, partial [Gammaproteobacteria bacterium]